MRAASVGLVALVIPFALAAQQPARISGVLRDTHGQPVPDVALLLRPQAKHYRTDASGRFSFELADGKNHLSIRRLGFEPVNLELALKPGIDSVLNVTLERRSQMLDTIVVTDMCARVTFDGFLCRRRKGEGIFLTEADILAKNPQFLADLLFETKGFHVEAQKGLYGPTRTIRPEQSRCLVTLVDGRKPPMQGFETMPMTSMEETGYVMSENDYYGPRDVIAVEIYGPDHETPIEYQPQVWKREADKSSLHYKSAISRVGRTRAAQAPKAADRCLFINYWTPRGLPKAKKAN